jgi:hypothetical protein
VGRSTPLCVDLCGTVRVLCIIIVVQTHSVITPVFVSYGFVDVVVSVGGGSVAVAVGAVVGAVGVTVGATPVANAIFPKISLTASCA